MPRKNILFARRETDKLWKYNTKTQKWTQDTHYENSRAGCKIFSFTWNNQRMTFFRVENVCRWRATSLRKMIATRLCKFFFGQSNYIRLRTGEESCSSVVDVFVCRFVMQCLQRKTEVLSCWRLCFLQTLDFRNLHRDRPVLFTECDKSRTLHGEVTVFIGLLLIMGAGRGWGARGSLPLRF